MTDPKRNTIARKIRKQPDIQRKFKAYRKLHKDGREGGRHHSAISSRKDLSPGEKLVLHTIGAAHDYRSHLFTSPVSLSLTFICNETSLSPSGVRKLTKQLEEKGLLIVTRRKDIHGADVPSHYQLTWKLFKDYIHSKYAKRLARIAAIPGSDPEPDPGTDGPGKKVTDKPVSEDASASEQPAPGLRLVHSSTATASSIWSPGTVTEWGGDFTWRGVITDSNQNETPSCDDSLSEGESAPSESVESEMPIRTDTLSESSPALSEGGPPLSEPLLILSSSSSSSKEDLNLNPPKSPLAVAKGESEKRNAEFKDRSKKAKRPYYTALHKHALSAFVIWQILCVDEWQWQKLGLADPKDVLRAYYPEIVVSLFSEIRTVDTNIRMGRRKGGVDVWIDLLEDRIVEKNLEEELKRLPLLMDLQGDHRWLIRHAQMKLENAEAG
jgi:DNA-binding MarR family transcriptional regulator